MLFTLAIYDSRDSFKYYLCLFLLTQLDFHEGRQSDFKLNANAPCLNTAIVTIGISLVPYILIRKW